MTSILSPISKSPSRFSAGIAAVKHKAAVISSKGTAPKFCHSFGDQLSDLGGQCRWTITQQALDVWLYDLSFRIDEVLRENEGAIYKKICIRDTAISRHCWMLGPTKDCAHPTAVICCDKTILLKRIMRIILKQDFLREKGFVLKGMAACVVRHLGATITPPITPSPSRSLISPSPLYKVCILLTWHLLLLLVKPIS